LSRKTQRERRSRRSAIECGRAFLVVAVGLSLGACGSGAAAHLDPSPVVAHVGGNGIERAAVERRTRVVERGGVIAGLGWKFPGSSRQQALSFLIASNWVIGEAARLGIVIPGSAVAQRLVRRREAYGGAQLGEVVRATGQTTADFRDEVEAELASEAIRRKLEAQASKITKAQVVAYYRRNRPSFRVPEHRVTDLAEDLTLPAARTIARRLGTGVRFAKRSFRETLGLAEQSGATAEKRDVLKAVFAAHPGVPSQPMKLNEVWMVFIVRQVIPSHIEPQETAQKTAFRRLLAERRQAITASYLATYRSRWVAQTSCSPGYVVQSCAQYRGTLQPEVDPFASG
jgi:hypothetical protein